MFEKEVVKAEDGSIAINAGGDVILVEGLDELLPALKEMSEVYLKQNPILLERKLENLENYVKILDGTIQLNKKRIDMLEVTKEPDTMTFLFDSMKIASLKGEKIDRNTLASLIAARLGTLDNMTQLAYEKAYDMISKLTPLQVKQIGSLYFVQICTWGINRQEEIEKFYERHIEILDFKFTSDTLNYLAGLGIISWTPGFINGPLTFEKLHEERYGIDINKVTTGIIPYIFEDYKKINGDTRLNTLGQIIGMEYLRNYIPNMSYINFKEI